MIDTKSLLDQFLGSNTAGGLRQAGGAARQKLDKAGGLGAFAGGAAAGGLLGLFLGNKKARKMAGGLVGYGGAAVLGALAFKAFQNWQQGRNPATAAPATQADLPAAEERFLPSATPATDGSPFELVLIRAMIGAAKADGHVDAEEQRRLFEQVDRLGLDAEAKAFVFDALARPIALDELATAVRTQEQAAEVYLASRLAIDPDHPAEKAYLEALAARLKLPGDLIAHLDRQVEGAAVSA